MCMNVDRLREGGYVHEGRVATTHTGLILMPLAFPWQFISSLVQDGIMLSLLVSVYCWPWAGQRLAGVSWNGAASLAHWNATTNGVLASVWLAQCISIPMHMLWFSYLLWVG